MECAWKEVKKDQGGSECVGTGPAAAHPMHNQHPAFLFPITTHLSSLLIPPRPRTKQHANITTQKKQKSEHEVGAPDHSESGPGYTLTHA